MAHARVAADTLHRTSVGRVRINVADNVLVTFATCVLGDAPAPFLDLDGFVKIVRREGQRMKEAVVRLGDPFAQRMVWKVTVVAYGNMAMAGILP